MSWENLLLKKPIFKVTETANGVWKEFLHENGHHFREFKSHVTVLGYPLVHIVRVRNPETGRLEKRYQP